MTNQPNLFYDHYKLLVLSVLCGRSYSWSSNFPPGFEDYFLRQTRHDGIQLLIYEYAAQNQSWCEWPNVIRQSLEHNSRNDAIIDILRQQNLVLFAALLRENGIEPILLKGTALSITHYSAPHLRTRSDTDVLIPAETAAKVRKILESRGFKVDERIQGEHINHQQLFYIEEGGARHFYDVHHKLMNPNQFAETLCYQEIAEESLKVSVLGEEIKSIGETHALLHACMHRVAHHYNEQRLIWLYDIHLLIAGKDELWIQDFYRLAAEKQMVKVCRESILLCCIHFNSIPEAWLSQFLNFQGNEESEKFLGRNTSPFSLFLNNFFGALTWRERAGLLGEHFFPSPAYMRAKYGLRSNRTLPFFYVWRIASGLPKIFTKLGQAPSKKI